MILAQNEEQNEKHSAKPHWNRGGKDLGPATRHLGQGKLVILDAPESSRNASASPIESFYCTDKATWLGIDVCLTPSAVVFGGGLRLAKDGAGGESWP